MTIDMLDTGTILVHLGESDMLAYTLDFSDTADITDVREGLGELVRRVGDMCGVGTGGRCFLVEALPSNDGCLLIISVRSVRRRRVYRIKREKTREICVFFDIDSMLDLMSRSEEESFGYTLYDYRGSCILMPESYVSSASRAELSEYGRLLKVSLVSAARIQEYGKVIREKRSHRRYPSNAAI